jgi:hypothetical protein
MAIDILSRLATQFGGPAGGGEAGRHKPDLGTRDIGGQFRNNQPYISGYFQTLFSLPDGLFKGNKDEASKWLRSTVEGFTPHSQTLNKVDIAGQGQIGSSFVGSVTTTREFTMTFREYQNMPILYIVRLWSAIFDPHTGVSPLNGEEFIPSNYKGSVCVIQTKPVKAKDGNLEASDIEELYVYQGVFPTTIPVDTAAASDITGNDTVQLSVTFSFDGAPLTSAELKKGDVAGWFNDVRAIDTYSKYRGQEALTQFGSVSGE